MSKDKKGTYTLSALFVVTTVAAVASCMIRKELDDQNNFFETSGDYAIDEFLGAHDNVPVRRYIADSLNDIRETSTLNKKGQRVVMREVKDKFSGATVQIPREKTIITVVPEQNRSLPVDLDLKSLRSQKTSKILGPAKNPQPAPSKMLAEDPNP